jgi:hypothetical protein
MVNSTLFADDYKLLNDVSTQSNSNLMQSALDELSVWSVANRMPLSLEKCATLHYGSNNPNRQYTVSQQAIRSVTSCIDLGVCRSNSFSYNDHIRSAALKAARLAGMTIKAFRSRQPSFLKKIFMAYIRPLLEYATPVWSPASTAMQQLLENVQRRYTKGIRGFSDIPYERHLQLLKLQSLKQRRLFHDVMLIFKCINGLLAVSPDSQGIELSRNGIFSLMLLSRADP